MSLNKNMKVLMVDDSSVTRLMEVEVLSMIGFTDILQSASAEDAFTRLENNPDIELIICDWNMPGKSGLELLEQIRADDRFRDKLFIMATGHAEKRQREKILAAGADGFISKPFDTDELEQTLIEAINKKPQKSEEETQKRRKGPARKKARMKVSHIQITDHLALGVMKHLIDTGVFTPLYFDLETVCMPGWNPVQKSLEKGEADAAFTLAPIAMDLFSYGAPIKLILFAHKNGSICITGNLEHEKKAPAEFFKGKTFFIPHILSIHHMLLNMFLRNLGLKPGLMGMEGVNVFFEVVPPVKMPEFLVKSPEASGFMVAEPVGANTIARGAGKLLYLSGEIWSNHPCCVVAIRDDFINENENAVFEFCDLLIKAGRYIFENVDDSASIAVNFLDPNAELGLQKPVLKKVLTEPFGIKTDDLYPQIDDLDRIQRYMSEEMGIGTIIDLEKFVDTRFADVFSKELNTRKQPSIFRGSKDIIQTAIQRIYDARPVEEIHPKTPLKKEKTVYEISENENTLCFRISTDENLIKQVLEETKDFLSNFTVTDTGPLIDVYGELLKNAMVHGNQNDHGKQIFCSVESLDDARFKIMVKDEGDGFDYQQSSVFQNPTSSSNHSPGGYQRISPLVEKLEFNETGSTITATIKLSFPDPYELSESGNWRIVAFTGDITEKHVGLLEGFFREMVENGWEKIRFDFSSVSHMDAKSLTLFSTLAKMRESRGIKRDLEIVNINDDLLNLFKMTRLDGAFKLDDEM